MIRGAWGQPVPILVPRIGVRSWLEARSLCSSMSLPGKPCRPPRALPPPLSCPAHSVSLCPESLPLLSALGWVTCRSGVFAAPRQSCPCLSCTMTIQRLGWGCLFLSSPRSPLHFSCPVVEATLEGMVGILRLSHSQAGRNSSAGGGQGRGSKPETVLFQLSAEWLTQYYHLISISPPNLNRRALTLWVLCLTQGLGRFPPKGLSPRAIFLSVKSPPLSYFLDFSLVPGGKARLAS